MEIGFKWSRSTSAFTWFLKENYQFRSNFPGQNSKNQNEKIVYHVTAYQWIKIKSYISELQPNLKIRYKLHRSQSKLQWKLDRAGAAIETLVLYVIRVSPGWLSLGDIDVADSTNTSSTACWLGTNGPSMRNFLFIFEKQFVTDT